MARASRRRRKNHGTRVPVGDLAAKFLARHVPHDRLRLVRVQLVWEQVAGPRLLGRAWPGALNGDELSINVCDNQWLHELSYMRDQLASRIAELAPAAGVRRVRLRLGPVPPPRDTRVPVPQGPEPPHYPPQPAPETLAALEGIEDPGLRHAIANARVALSRL